MTAERIDNLKTFMMAELQRKSSSVFLLGENGMGKDRLQAKKVMLSLLVMLLVQALLLSQTGFCLAASSCTKEASQRIAQEFQKINNEKLSNISALHKHKVNKEIIEGQSTYDLGIMAVKVVIGPVHIWETSMKERGFYFQDASRAPPKNYNQFCSISIEPNRRHNSSSVFSSAKNSELISNANAENITILFIQHNNIINFT